MAAVSYAHLMGFQQTELAVKIGCAAWLWLFLALALLFVIEVMMVYCLIRLKQLLFLLARWLDWGSWCRWRIWTGRHLYWKALWPRNVQHDYFWQNHAAHQNYCHGARCIESRDGGQMKLGIRVDEVFGCICWRTSRSGMFEQTPRTTPCPQGQKGVRCTISSQEFSGL